MHTNVHCQRFSLKITSTVDLTIFSELDAIHCVAHDAINTPTLTPMFLLENEPQNFSSTKDKYNDTY